MDTRALQAAELTYSELIGLEPIVIGDLDYNQILLLLKQLSEFLSDAEKIDSLSTFEAQGFEGKDYSDATRRRHTVC
jgi:hypothetical protein